MRPHPASPPARARARGTRARRSTPRHPADVATLTRATWSRATVDQARHDAIDVGEIAEEQIRPARRQLVGQMLAGRDGDRHRAAAARALDVEGRVADDRDAVERELVAEGSRSLARDRRQAPPIGIVAAVGGHPEERPEPRRLELDPRARLDVAGEEPDDRVRPRAELPDHLRHARQDLHARAVADDPGELARVDAEAVVDPRADARDVQTRLGHQLLDDGEVGAPAEVEVLDRARGAVDLLERAGEGGAPGAADGHERAVDIEEKEAHLTVRPAGAGGRPPRGPRRARDRSRSRWSSGRA